MKDLFNTTLTVASVNEDFDTFEALKEALFSDRWPEAANPALMCDPNSEKDKKERGFGIIQMIVQEEIRGQKVLDFGCGEGHTACAVSTQSPKLCVAYDIEKFEHWQNSENTIFTNDFSEVEKNAPYDIVILFDVIDHLKNEDQISVLRKIHSVLTDNGKVYMRCHPFTSRHATHLYQSLNKAYIHLVFTPEEIRQLIPEPVNAEINLGVVTPFRSYKYFAQKAGFEIVSRQDITERVEPFFKTPTIAERIMKTTQMPEFPEYQMGIQFLDMVLKK